MKSIGAVILAGGMSRRMKAEEKSLVALQGAPMLQHVIDRVKSQTVCMVLNANGNQDRFADFGLPVVADDMPDHPGPLAGMLAGLEWMRNHRPDLSHVLTVPCDTPVLPTDLAARLRAALEGEATAADLALAASGGRVHPVVAMVPVSLADDLRHGLMSEGIRKAGLWVDRHRTAIVQWSAKPIDPFANINTPEELSAAGAWLGADNVDHAPCYDGSNPSTDTDVSGVDIKTAGPPLTG